MRRLFGEDGDREACLQTLVLCVWLACNVRETCKAWSDLNISRRRELDVRKGRSSDGYRGIC